MYLVFRISLEYTIKFIIQLKNILVIISCLSINLDCAGNSLLDYLICESAQVMMNNHGDKKCQHDDLTFHLNELFIYQTLVH